ncbi:MAG: DNA polymerase III subunit delta [Bacilli bacterium]|nr:DNA polymerase III subunit delta [Bacilli bacterium]
MENIYVLYGEDKSLIDKELKKIITNNFKDDFENNISTYNMNDTSLNKILEDANTMPFLSDKKIIICNDCYFLTGSKDNNTELDTESLLKYIDNYNDSTILIFIVNNEKLDERKKIVKTLKNKAVVKVFNKLNSNEMINYIKNIFLENNYQISERAILSLMDRINGNIEYAENEANKLMLYKMEDKKILEEDIDEIVRKIAVDNVFELVDAVSKKDINRTLDLYKQLLINNEEPIKVIAILGNQFRLIYQTKKLYKQGYTERDIASKLAIHPYRIKLANESKLNEKELLTYLDKLADLDIGIKSGEISKYVGLELFFLQQ